MTQTLEQLSAAATGGEWIATDWQKDDGPNPSTICRTRKEELKPGQTSIWPDGIIYEKIADCEEGQHPLQDAAFIVALVNAYRTGQLVSVSDDAVERVAMQRTIDRLHREAEAMRDKLVEALAAKGTDDE